MKKKNTQYWLNLYNFDFVNAKTGKVLTRSEKFINFIVNAILSITIYLLIIIVLCIPLFLKIFL
jgi:hypothetical protein